MRFGHRGEAVKSGAMGTGCHLSRSFAFHKESGDASRCDVCGVICSVRVACLPHAQLDPEVCAGTATMIVLAMSNA